MRMGIRTRMAAVLALAATSACKLPPMISNSGYRGTWSRAGAHSVSIVAITELEGRWYFRWTKRSVDGGQTLATDTVEERVYPSRNTLRYSDVMQVDASGLTLWSYTTDRDGQHFEGGARPQRSFTKVADSVANPPRPERP